MTRLLLISAVTALAATTGCISNTGHPAPAYARLSDQGDVTLAWSSEFNDTDDGVGVLVLLDFMVYDEEQGIPMENIRVEVLSTYGGVYVIPKTAVKIVPYPIMTEEEKAALCDQTGGGENGDEPDGYIDPDAPDECSWNWDTSGDVYFEIGNDYAAAYHANYLIGATDNRGIFRTYVYVDSLPRTGGGDDEEGGDVKFDTVNIWASIGYDQTEVAIGPSSN